MVSSTFPNARIAIVAQYFIYFGVLGIFLPYFNLYCYHIGLNSMQIGTIAALRSVVMVAAPLGWGYLADRYRVRKPIYIVCTFISALVWSGFLATTAYGPMVLLTIAYAIFYAPVISFLEALTIDFLGANKKSYGQIRLWGSISFILTVALVGRLVDLLDLTWIVWLLLMGSGVQAIGSLGVPATRTQHQARFARGKSFLSQRKVIVFLFCAFLMLLSHGAYYGFFSIHLEALGYGPTFIGMTWAVASCAEIVAMVFSERIFQRFNPKAVLVASLLVAALRWTLLAFAQSAHWILLLQCLHAFSYGTFHMASILYIDALAPSKSKTLGQAVNNALTYGLGLMIGFFLSGYFYETLGMQPLLLASSTIAVAATLIFKLADRSEIAP
jgi:PPP family 3-phenylpropionic acid transporter